ncbi:unnamed protein product [Leptidea sinapis]|uniref:Uncharacterized protein n=1 Tax=Leptidea sinapis TaxID=189913 RepID=A0A5E4Q8K7_9NEOP|nr:unnamed protein product [Leptidea sinapis]
MGKVHHVHVKKAGVVIVVECKKWLEEEELHENVVVLEDGLNGCICTWKPACDCSTQTQQCGDTEVYKKVVRFNRDESQKDGDHISCSCGGDSKLKSVDTQTMECECVEAEEHTCNYKAVEYEGMKNKNVCRFTVDAYFA